MPFFSSDIMRSSPAIFANSDKLLYLPPRTRQQQQHAARRHNRVTRRIHIRAPEKQFHRALSHDADVRMRHRLCLPNAADCARAAHFGEKPAVVRVFPAHTKESGRARSARFIFFFFLQDVLGACVPKAQATLRPLDHTHLRYSTSEPAHTTARVLSSMRDRNSLKNWPALLPCSPNVRVRQTSGRSTLRPRCTCE